MKAKRILILKGSARKNSNSSILADHLAGGAKAVGAEVESLLLHQINIKPCRGYEACHQSDDSHCTIDDEMQSLYPKLISADSIVIASPIYWFTFNTITKTFIDRWYALEKRRGNALKGKELALILTYGDANPCTSGGINAIRAFEDMCRYLKFAWPESSMPRSVLPRRSRSDRIF